MSTNVYLVQHPLPPQSAAALESVYSTPGASHPGVSGPPAAYPSEVHPQSAPGRRTPLGTVGLGGFYFQQQPQPHASSSALSDENRPDERSPLVLIQQVKTVRGYSACISRKILILQ